MFQLLSKPSIYFSATFFVWIVDYDYAPRCHSTFGEPVTFSPHSELKKGKHTIIPAVENRFTII